MIFKLINIFVLSLILLLYGADCVWSATTTWTNTAGDRNWATSSNWSLRVPQTTDTVVINPDMAGPIIHSSVRTASIIKIGDTGTGQANLYLDANSTLNVSSTCSVGHGISGTININGGFLDIVLGENDLYGYLDVGGANGGNGVVEMTGGMIQTRDLRVGYFSGTGAIHLNGGIIEITNPSGGLNISARGQINISNGSILLVGDQTIAAKEDVNSQKIVAYDGYGRVLIDYDHVNPGKTTIWAVSPDMPVDFDGSGMVSFGDLLYFANSWLDNNLQVRPIGDVSGDSKVNCVDFSSFANYWGARQKLNFALFIGPNDCPGATQFADPYVLTEGGEFYLTSTYAYGQPKYMFRTKNFVDKMRYTLSVNYNESYLRTFFNDQGITVYDLWGLVPYKHTDNSWHAYGTVHIGNFKSFVCHFSPVGSTTWPILNWKLDKVLVGSPSNSAYESKVYSDATGMYLFYDYTISGNNNIMTWKMLDPNTMDSSFTPRAVLSPESTLHSEDYTPGDYGFRLCEGANIKQINGKYVMFYSVGNFAESNYKLGIAYSDVLVPSVGQKYSKAKSYDSRNVWGNTIARNEVVYTLQTQLASWPNFYASLFDGPGLGNAVEYMGNYYIVFHARYSGQTGSGDGRWVWICPLTVNFNLSMPLWVVTKLPNAELINNGSFEANTGNGTTPSGWTKDFSCYGAYDGAYVTGSYCLHPGNGGPPGGAYQDISTVTGAWYNVTLWAQNFGGAAGIGNAKVLIGNPGTDTYTFENGTSKTTAYSLTGLVGTNCTTGIPWAKFSLAFQAVGTTTRVGVYNDPFSGSFSTNVDDFSVKASD